MISSIFSALLLLTSCSVFAASSHSSEPLARDCLGRPGFRFTGVLSTTSSRVPLGLKMGSSSSLSTSKSTSSSCASIGEAGGGGFFFMRLGLYPFGLPRGRFTGTPSTIGTVGTVGSVAAAG